MSKQHDNACLSESGHPTSSSQDLLIQSSSSGGRRSGRQSRDYADSEPNRQPNRSQFTSLIERLIGNFCPLDDEANRLSIAINEEEFQRIYNQLEQIIRKECPQNRREDGTAVLRNSRTIYQHLLYLKNKESQTEKLANQVEKVLDALQQTTKFSHDQFYGPVRALENRKLQISLGMVEALTELFVLDIDTFGLQLDGYEKCSKLRRSIGNSLMNLVYQQPNAKEKLCKKLSFLRRVADVIAQVHPLVQFYAGLIQNVSYNADPKIAYKLSITVPPLVNTAISIAYEERDGKIMFDMATLAAVHKQHLLKILSALWNLAETPIENKRVMCHDVRQFVPLLIKIMYSDHRELQFIQAATGIVKHLCTYILQFPPLFSRMLRKGIVVAFLRQFVSPSPDLVTDSLIALSLLSRHPIVAKDILQQEVYIQQISFLIRNTNEGISRASRTLLDTIHSASIYYQFQPLQPEMCTSMVSWPAKPGYVNSNLPKNIPNANAHHYFTLPRTPQNQHTAYPQQQFYDQQQNTSKGITKPSGFDEMQNLIEREDNAKATADDSDDNPFLEDPSIDTGHQDLSTSVQCTREVSPRSSPSNSANDGKVDQEEWPSVQSISVRSSGAQSTASASELPDSPSQCVSFQLKQMEIMIQKALDENKRSGNCTNANVSGDTENKNVEEKSTADGVDAEEEQFQEDSGRIGGDQSGGGSLLLEAILNHMPKPQLPSNQNQLGPPVQFSFTQTSTPILTPISNNSPCKSPNRGGGAGADTIEKRRRKQQSDRLLEESIVSAMPIRRRNSPNCTARLFGSRNTSDSGTSPNRRPHNNSEDDDFLFGSSQKEDVKMPSDVAKEIDAQWITVDCQKISPQKPSNSSGSESSLRRQSFQRPPSTEAAAHHASHIPVLLTPPKAKSGSQSGTLASPSSSSSEKSKMRSRALNSPQKVTKNPLLPPRGRKPPPPPLAPKPRMPPLPSNMGNLEAKEQTDERIHEVADKGKQQQQLLLLAAADDQNNSNNNGLSQTENVSL